MVSEPATLPGDHGARLDEDECVPPGRPGPRQPRPEETIGDLDAGARTMPLVDGELATKREDLKLKGGPGPKAGAERGGEGEEDCHHGGCKTPPWRAPTLSSGIP